MSRTRWSTVLLVLAISMFGSALAARAQNATLAWDANTEPNVMGYRVFYGTQSHVYPNSIDVGNTTSYTFAGLDRAKDYYFAVQAYTSQGLSSTLSAEVQLPASLHAGTTTITSFTANAGYPLLVGKPVTWTATATSSLGAVEYRFLLFSPKGTGWTQLQDYSLKSSVTWTPTWSDVGPHVIQVWARSVGSPLAYEAWVNTDDFAVNTSPVQVTADVDFPTPPGNPVHWTASIAGADSTPLEYRFIMLDRSTGVWSQLRDYSPSNQFTWVPPANGDFVVQVWARRVGTTAAYDVWGNSIPFSIARTPLTVSSFTSDTSFPTTTGTAIKWTARVRGGTSGPIQYRFIRYSDATGWQLIQDYSTSNTCVWTPKWGEQGKYHLQVWVRNANSTAGYDAWLGTDDFQVDPAPLQISLDQTFPIPPGTSVKLTGQVADAQQAFEYRFVLYDRGTGIWSEARPYSTDNTYTWTPASTGTFLFQVWARQVGSTAAYDVWRGTDYLTVSRTPAHLVSITANQPLPAKAGTAITWTAVGSGGTAAPLEYRFIMYTDGGGWTQLQDWSPSNTLNWTPTTQDIGLGRHEIQVWIRSHGSTAAYEDWMNSVFFDIQ